MRIRIKHKSETSAFAWQMACDVCPVRDPVLYPGRSCQPPLYRFHLLGWFVGELTDVCPACVKAGKVGDRDPYFTEKCLARLRAAAASRGTDASTALLAPLTDAEIDTLRIAGGRS